MNDRKQCLLVFLAAFSSSMLIVCVLVAERHHDSDWAGNLRMRDDNDFISFLNDIGNGSGFFSGSGMLPVDKFTNGTNGTNGTDNFQPFIDPPNLEGKIGEVVTFTCGGNPNQPSLALFFIFDREEGVLPVLVNKVQNIVLFPDFTLMVEFGPLTVEDDGDSVVCIFFLPQQVYFAAADITVLRNIILTPERNQSVLVDSNVNVTYDCTVDQGRVALWEFRGIQITPSLYDTLEENGVFITEGSTVSDISITITPTARSRFGLEDLDIVCVAEKFSSFPPEVEFSPTYYVRTVVPPSAPRNPILHIIGPNYANLSWAAPLELGRPELSTYEVLAQNLESGQVRRFRTVRNETGISILGLRFGVNYQFTVVALSESDGVVGRSEESQPRNGTTDFVAAMYTLNVTEYTLNEGDHFILVVDVFGDPLPTTEETSLTFNGQPVVSTPDLHYTYNVIYISRVSAASAGEYTLTSTTLGGTSDPLSFTIIIRSQELEVYFVNNTPVVTKDRIYAEFESNRPGASLLCHLIRFDNTKEDCSSGQFEREGVPPGNYVLRIVARDPSNPQDKIVLRNAVSIPKDDEFCVVGLQNRGLTVSGNSATIEFYNIGVATRFECVLDRTDTIEDCTSPYTVGNLTSGQHQFRITPLDCGRKFKVYKMSFTV